MRRWLPWVLGALLLALAANGRPNWELERRLAKCPKAVAVLGRAPQVLWTKNVYTAGVWSPPVGHCTRVAALQGAAATASLYYTEWTLTPCFHVIRPTGHMTESSGASAAQIQVIDVDACTESLTGSASAEPVHGM